MRCIYCDAPFHSRALSALTRDMHLGFISKAIATIQNRGQQVPKELWAHYDRNMFNGERFHARKPD